MKLFSKDLQNVQMKSKIVLDLSEELKTCAVFQNEISMRQTGEKNDAQTSPCKTLEEFMQDSSDEDDGEIRGQDPSHCAQQMLNSYMSSTNESFSDLLKDHKCVSYLFLKYNTTLRSNAACERLFSMAKYVLTLQRCKLSDRNFERQLLVKANLHLTNEI